ncbi:MAG: hypothetical protein K1X88_22565 [Nannocystaceae bacterium]|nr:hypothetical protein [Nannocystaceae bacterium]
MSFRRAIAGGVILGAMLVPLRPAAAQQRSAATERSVEEVSAKLLAWVADPDPAAAAALDARVRAGVPPGALLAVLDALARTPRLELGALLHELACYRSVDVRARALTAWAAMGDEAAPQAIARAAADVALPVRRLAVALAQRHPSAAARATIEDLLARDAELAAELAAPAPVLIEEPQDVVVEDEP